MKKLLSVLLLVIAGLLVFTACNPESKLTDELVSVRLLTGSEDRALKAEVDFDVSKVSVWKYSATKADNGLKTGEITDGTLDSNKQTAALSQGAWNFVLKGYDSSSQLICQGKADDVLITTKSNSVTITVNPLQTDKGTIKIADSIVITDKEGNSYDAGDKASEYTKGITVTPYPTGEALADQTASDGYYTYENVTSGIYKVVVTFTGTHNEVTYTAATATKYINVYDHLTTEVSGTIAETEQAATITAEGNFEATKTINADYTSETGSTYTGKNSKATQITFDFTPVGAKDESVEEKKNLESVFSFPAGSIKKTSNDTTPSITYKTASAGTAAKTYEITDASGAVVAVFDITAEGFDSKDLKGENDEYPTITSYIGKNLGESFDATDNDETNDDPTLNIQYFGDYTETNETKAELLSYNKETGYLTYRVKHFSTYMIISNNIVATDDDGEMYNDFGKAVAGAADGATITLWKDVELAETITIDEGKTLTINLNSHTVTLKESLTTTDDGTFYTAIENKGTLTIKNGTLSYDGTSPNTKGGSRKVISNSGTLNTAGLNVKATLTAACDLALTDIQSAIDDSNSCPLVTVVMNSGKAYFDGSSFTLTVKLSENLNGVPISSRNFAGVKPIVIFSQGSDAEANINDSTITSTTEVPGGVIGLYVVDSEATVSDSTISSSNSSFGWTRPVFVEGQQSGTQSKVTVTKSTINSTDTLAQSTITDVLTEAGLTNSVSLSASANRVYGFKVRGNAIVNVDSTTMNNLEVSAEDGTKIPYAGETYGEGSQQTAKGTYGKILDSEKKVGITVKVSEYSSFETAMEYAPDGSTVVLDEDVELSKGLTIVKNLILDMAGHNITYTGNDKIFYSTSTIMFVLKNSAYNSNDEETLSEVKEATTNGGATLANFNNSEAKLIIRSGISCTSTKGIEMYYGKLCCLANITTTNGTGILVSGQGAYGHAYCSVTANGGEGLTAENGATCEGVLNGKQACDLCSD